MAIGAPAGHINCLPVDVLVIGIGIGIVCSIFSLAIRANLAAAIDSMVAGSVLLIFASGRACVCVSASE